jgi:hypothetical protein
MSIGLAAIYCFNEQIFRIPSVTKLPRFSIPKNRLGFWIWQKLLKQAADDHLAVDANGMLSSLVPVSHR